MFPHSDICGLTDVCSSPQLFAAYRVLLRLSVPRHPPCALSSLTMITVLVILPLPHSVASAVFCLLSDAPISRILLLEFFLDVWPVCHFHFRPTLPDISISCDIFYHVFHVQFSRYVPDIFSGDRLTVGHGNPQFFLNTSITGCNSCFLFL